MSGVCSIFREGLFQNKVAIVSGGGTGIGKVISKELLSLGCKVVIASRKIDRLTATESELNNTFHSNDQPNVTAVQCDIRKEQDVKHLMKETLAKYGRIDFLVNNGGGQFPSPAAKISPNGWNAVINTNLTGTFLMCREAYDSWMRDHGGSIVTIIACMFNGWPMQSHSGAARAGVENLTKSLAIEWAQNGIRINAVAPGVIYTDTAAEYYGDKVNFNSHLSKIPARRLGTSEEVSAAVSFLLSPAAAYVSGITMKVDGGWTDYGNCAYTVPDHDNLPAYSWKSEDVDTGKDRKSKL